MDAHGPAVPGPPPEGEGILESSQALAGSHTTPAAPEIEELHCQAARALSSASGAGSSLLSAPPPEEGSPSGLGQLAPCAQAPLLVYQQDTGLRYVHHQSAPKQFALGILLASLPVIGVELVVNVPFLGWGVTQFFLSWVIRLIGAACLFGGLRATRQPLMKWWGWGVLTGLLLAILLLLYLRARFGLTTY